MSSLFSGEKKVQTNTNQQSEAWAPTLPTLKDLIGKINGLSSTTVGATTDQTTAMQTLKDQAKAGNPWVTQIGDLTTKMFGAGSGGADAKAAFADMKTQLTPYADGSKVNANDPALREAIDLAATDVQDRINRQWAGAGRDLSPGNAMAVSKGVASVAVPATLDYITKQQANQIGASQALQSAGMGTAAAAQQLDQASLDQQTKGIDTAKSYLEAQGWGPEQIANLEQQLKELPAQDVARVMQLIMPIAGSGGQQTGEAVQRTTQTPSVMGMVGGGLSLASKFVPGLGQLSSISDIISSITKK